MRRAKLRQVVSAVYHLKNGRGVRLSDIEEYLRLNYGVLSAPEYKPVVKLAVKEGFLKLKNNRFHPLRSKHSSPGIVVARRRRRSRRRNGRNRLLRMAVDYLLARRRRGSGRRRRRGRRHEGTEDLLTARRRRRRSRRRRGHGHEGEASNKEEEKKEQCGESNRDKPEDTTTSPFVEKDRSNDQGSYFG